MFLNKYCKIIANEVAKPLANQYNLNVYQSRKQGSKFKCCQSQSSYSY
jgi:hypothetical protein